MQVSLNTNNYNTQYYRKNVQNNYYKTSNIHNSTQLPSFCGYGLPSASRFLEPLNKGFDKFTDFLARTYTKTLYESKPAKWLSRQDSVGQIVNHMQTIGSIIVSGMYMGMTLRNKNMDDETKKKLSINQGLTWVAATLGAYGLDAALDKAWDNNVSLKHAANFLYDPENSKYANKKDFYKSLVKGLKDHNKKLKAEFEANPANKKSGIFGKKKFKPVLATKYIDEIYKNKTLVNELKGLDAFKSLAIFGSIYRFVSPVAVTPLANWIGDKIFNKEDISKTTENINPMTQNLMLKTPKMSQFAGGIKKSA